MKVAATISVILAVCVGCGDDCIETSGDLSDALSGASAGDTVRACAGRFEGAFEVPSGVTLRGAGAGETVLSGPDGDFSVRLRPSADESIDVRDLSVEWRSHAAVLAMGEGAVSMQSVVVEVHDGASTGLGIAAEGLSGLALTDVSVLGPVTRENPRDYPHFDGVAQWTTSAPAFGIVSVRVSGGVFEEVEVRGFSAGGVQLIDGVTSWVGGSICGNLETSLLVYGGQATLEAVEICDLFKADTGRLVAPTGVFVAEGASLSTTGLRVTGSEEGSVGVVHDRSSGSHDGLVVTGNLHRGVQVQHCEGSADAPSVSLRDVDLSRNGYAGLLAVEATGIVVDGATIDETVLRASVEADIGDGVQIVRCADPGVACETALAGIVLQDLRLANNGRVGLLVSANNDTASGVSVDGVTVSGEGAAFGALVQLADDAPGGWDSIAREGAVAANDPTFDGILETAGVVDPEFLPGQELSGGGLGAALGDLD